MTFLLSQHFGNIGSASEAIHPLVQDKSLFLSTPALHQEALEHLRRIAAACEQLPQMIKLATPDIPWSDFQTATLREPTPNRIYQLATVALPTLHNALKEIQKQLGLLQRNLSQLQHNQRITITSHIGIQQINLDLAEIFFDSIHQHHSITDAYRLRLQRIYPSLDVVQKLIRTALSQKFLVDGTPDFFVFYENQLAGMFEFHPITEPQQIEIGYWLYEEFHRKGILSQLMPKMIHYARRKFQVTSVLATTGKENIASRRLLEKCGFVLRKNAKRTADKVIYVYTC